MQPHRMSIPVVIISLSFLFLGQVTPKADAQPPNQQIFGLGTTNGFVRAQAQPDECFSSIGHNFPFSKPPCFFSTPKVNQAYIWGMTDAGADIWFGTIANPQCITEGGLVSDPSQLVPYQTDSWVCEFGSSPYSPTFLPAIIGDFRPPQIFVYNKSTKSVMNMTPTAPVSSSNPFGLDPLVLTTLGIHAAATIGNLVLLGGESLLGGINLFAFRADTHEYLGAKNIAGAAYNIRQFTILNGNIYTGVATHGSFGGEILKFTGSISPNPCDSCFTFEVVGQLDGQAVYITDYKGRLVVGTWPTGVPGVLASIYMSPLVPTTGGLTAANLSQWTKIWDASMYEPDPVIARAYAMGAMFSYQGYLYWGTLHIPFQATAQAAAAYGQPATDQDSANLVIGTFRTISIFRGRNFDTTPDIDLLYGSSALPAFSPTGGTPGTWPYVPNNMPPLKRNPLYGPAGFGNPYNTYTWSMNVWNNRLWIGTMDWSYQAQQGTQTVLKALNMPYTTPIQQFFAFQNFGADLYSFATPRSPATLESNSGVGNYTSFGIRNMVSTPGSLFLGMANASNLLTNPFAGPTGGWELIELTPK
ncbi:MAG: hypothetical protein JWO80_2108 [Bryobacterales bacterium]|nr:hypothetical protein [Bryobacterales bacterium]